MAKPFELRLRTLRLTVVPVAVMALPLGYFFLQRPVAPVPVTGSVRLDGANCEWVRVVFIPVSPGGKIGECTTGSLGDFELKTWIDDTSYPGLLPGSYAVLVEDISSNVMPEGAIPKRYQDAATSGLSATVTRDGPNNFNFSLTYLPQN
ncbi:MAG TPA: hypothetical protein VND64_13995 [Pirellulales bacterium]|nr:hypothetical protein [Pirellulales bacterium]